VLRALVVLTVLFARKGEVLLKDGTPAPPIQAWPGRFDGHITIVDFSATWCPHCRDALADEQRLMAAFGDRVQLVIVDVGEDPQIVRAFFSQVRVPAGAALLVDPASETAKAWRVSAYPTMYLVDRAGLIRDEWSGWGHAMGKYLADMVVYLEGKSGRDAKLPGKRRVTADRARSAARRAEDARARSMGVEILH
jgi:thiol-disulfide isomerase/thioredoxin